MNFPLSLDCFRTNYRTSFYIVIIVCFLKFPWTKFSNEMSIEKILDLSKILKCKYTYKHTYIWITLKFITAPSNFLKYITFTPSVLLNFPSSFLFFVLFLSLFGPIALYCLGSYSDYRFTWLHTLQGILTLSV